MGEKIRTGDLVKVLVGKYRGVQGKVLSVDLRSQRLVVERVNMVKRHQKPTARNRQGGIVEREAPIARSNVGLVHKGELTRVGFRVLDGKKVRWSRKHDEAIDG